MPNNSPALKPSRVRRVGSLCLGVVLLLCLAAAPPLHAEGSNFVAVLNIAGAEGGDLAPSTLQLVSDEARDAVRIALPKATVITSDTTETILRDLGTSQTACLEGADCALDIFREMQAEVGLSGAITMLGDSFWVAWNAYDVASGKLVGRGRVTVDGEAQLPDASREAATKAVDDLAARFGGGQAAEAVSVPNQAGAVEGDDIVLVQSVEPAPQARRGGGGAFWRALGEVIGGILGVRPAPRRPGARPGARAPSRSRAPPPGARGNDAGTRSRVTCVKQKCPSCFGEPKNSPCWARWQKCAAACGCKGAHRSLEIGAACS